MNNIVDELNKHGYEAYIVGGYVRDYLLSYESKDIDICTNAKIEDIERIFQERGRSYPNYYSYHIKEHDCTYDITSYRKELKYKNNKPCKIVYAKTLKEDLKRRDFTINTLAIDKNGKLIDLMHAKKDLDRKIIRVVGDTETRLKEDKTRIIIDVMENKLDKNKSSYLRELQKMRKDFMEDLNSINKDSFDEIGFDNKKIK